MINFKTGLLIWCAATLVACGSKDAKAPDNSDVPKVESGVEAPEAPTTTTWKLNRKELAGYNYDISKYAGIDVGEPMEVTVQAIRKYLTPEGEGNMSVTWETLDLGKGIKTFSGLATNMADDSVKDMEIKAVFKKDDGEYWLIEHGGRVKCWRGDNQNKWTANPCS